MWTLFILLSCALMQGQVTDSMVVAVDSVKFLETTSVDRAIDPLQSLDSLVMKNYEEVDRFDQAYMDMLYDHDGYEYLFKNIDSLPNVGDSTLSTDTLKARLQRINERTPFNIEYNPILEQLIKKQLTYKRVYLERIMTLSDYYFPMFEEQLDRYDIPLEMKYLAVVESALDPKIKSRVGATGLWQFMYATGKGYGLEVNSYVDERMDPNKSTIAACKYLNRLYSIYDDWDLALAAYNSGAGNVNKAIRRSGGKKNYWNLRPHLPRETAGYVPKFQAMMYLFTYAQEHGFKPQRTSRLMMETDTVLIKNQISFDQIESQLDIDKETIEFFNPSYKLGIIPIEQGKPHYLRLPIEQVAVIAGNEDKVYAFAKAEFEKREQPLPELLKPSTSITYRVRSGDYLGKIAARYNVRVSEIKRWNRLRSNKLTIGQRLKINTTTGATRQTAKVKNYVVRSGDSLWAISRRNNMTVKELKRLNPKASKNLKPGMTLVLK
ncbi:LysM peptidoglycan-binding domain-containing protein [Nonlabens ponticola]|nr:LysM peptidoglycan-binding domain-containing protein [Nonlabens ponticola]